MLKYTIFILAVVLLGLTKPLGAQEQSDGGVGSQAVIPPALVNGQTGSLAFTSELGNTNYLRGGVALTSNFDDNALNSSTNPISDIGYSILPHVAMDQSFGRLSWTGEYTGGFTLYQHVTSYNQASHNFGLRGQYRLTPHVTLRLSDRFNDSTNFFNQLDGAFGLSAGSILQSPNDNFVRPLQRAIGNFLTAGADYQVGAGTVVGVSGTFYYNRYKGVADNEPTTSNLLNNHSDQAQGFYTHRISNKNWVGVEYDFQRLTFGPGNGETIVHSVHYFHTINLQSHMTLSFFAGPEYSQTGLTTSGLQPTNYRNLWSASGGATYNWQGEHISTVTEFVRRVSDGGGFLGGVQVTSVNSDLRRRLTRSLDVTFGGAYATNQALGNPSALGSSVEYWGATAGLERRLTERLILSFGYARQDQRQSGGTLLPTITNHNRGWFSLAYNFTRPLGR